MNKLENARAVISRVDEQMRDLFLARMEAVKAVAEYKQENGLPTFDAKREAELIEHNAAFVDDPVMREYYVQFLRNNMAVSRAYQDRLRTGMKVAFAGIYGAFAHIAVQKIYGDVTAVPCADFKSAYDAVVNGECDAAVLPIENSTAGEVGSVMDMMFSGPLYVTGVYDLYITQHLMAKKGATTDGIRKVVSHPQALAQCAGYLRGKGWEISEFENTAVAAKFVADRDDPTIAAIASEETASLYGLEILARNINEVNVNMTRFATFSKVRTEAPDKKDRHSILMLTVTDSAGALARVVNIIGEYGYNMRCLRSRPMKGLLWTYYFYIEVEDNLDSEKGKRMIAELSANCDKLRHLGSFPYPAELH